MSDNTFVITLFSLIFICSLCFCGEPDLHDAVIHSVMERSK